MKRSLKKIADLGGGEGYRRIGLKLNLLFRNILGKEAFNTSNYSTTFLFFDRDKKN